MATLSAQAKKLSAQAKRMNLLSNLEARHPCENVRRRVIDRDQWDRFTRYMYEIFEAMGMEMNSPGTMTTPERFLLSLFDSTDGYETDPKLLTNIFPTEYREELDGSICQVIEGPISFFSLCEHHSLPFFGHAHVAYVANERTIGTSNLARLVRIYARRFTVQERVGQEIADALVELLEPCGVAVQLEAVHLCTQMRGVREEQSRTWTSFWRGNYERDSGMRREFLRVCGTKG